MEKQMAGQTANVAAINYLNYLYRSYDRVTHTIAQVQQIHAGLHTEVAAKNDFILGEEDGKKGLLYVKGAISRKMEKELAAWPIWTEWLRSVPGVGPALAAPLVLWWSYRFTPACPACSVPLVDFVCPECGKEAKGAGCLSHIIEPRNFPTISSWWAFMGRSVEDGHMPKRKAGVQSTWSTARRTLGFQIGDQFNRQTDKTEYGKYLLERKRLREKTHPEASKGHRLNMAKNETIKLFLSHFWQVARTLEGKPLTLPYAHAQLGHADFRPPFYWARVE